MQIKTTVRYITSHQSEWPPSKSLQTINAGEGVEEKEPCYASSGNVNCYSHCGEQYGGSLRKYKTKQGPTVAHRELYSVLCNNINRKKIWKRIDLFVYV